MEHKACNTGELERGQEAGGTPAHGSRFNYYHKQLEKKENPSRAQGWEGLSRTAGQSVCSFPWTGTCMEWGERWSSSTKCLSLQILHPASSGRKAQTEENNNNKIT